MNVSTDDAEVKKDLRTLGKWVGFKYFRVREVEARH